MNSHRNKVTIKPDVTYSTSGIFAQSNKLTIEKLAKTMSEYTPNLIIRFECVMFGIGCTHESALKISITNEKRKVEILEVPYEKTQEANTVTINRFNTYYFFAE